MGGGFSSSTYNGNPCLPPLENSLPCMAWLAWVDQSGTLWKCFIDSWHLDLRCHYLLNYPMNCCMHILFQHYISTVIDEYTIHFDGSYWKYDEMVDQKEVNFSRGAHSTNPCGMCYINDSHLFKFVVSHYDRHGVTKLSHVYPFISILWTKPSLGETLSIAMWTIFMSSMTRTYCILVSFRLYVNWAATESRPLEIHLWTLIAVQWHPAV